MNNLTTRKIVLGLLMTLVLALGVQGTADALSTMGFDTDTTTDMDELNISGTIIIDIDVTPDLTNTRDSVKLSVSGGGATFLIGDSPKSSYTWHEPDGDTTTTGFQDGTFPTIDNLSISVTRVGEVTVTLTDESNTSSANRMPRQVRTFYVVKYAADISPSDTISLLNVTNGVGAGYTSSSDVEIYRGDSRHNPITYTTTSGGTLYIKEGTRGDATGPQAETATLTTSSGANVWLSMGTDTDATENSHTVTASLATEFIATGTYIYGPRPKLTVTRASGLSSGDPGERITSAITATVTDKDDDLTDGNTVEGVPVKFEVADKSNTGSYLIPQGMVVDVNNKVITPTPTTAKILYVRTGSSGAIVDVQLASTPGNGEITVSVVGKNVNVSEKFTVGTPPTELSIISNVKRAGNSKIFDLVARVMRGDKPLHGLEVIFQTTRGNLTNTPTKETSITDPDGGEAVDDDENSSGFNATDITDRNGDAQVSYNIGENSGRQEINAIIYNTEPAKRRIVTFVVNGPADPSGGGTGGTGGTGTTTQTPALTINTSGTGATRSVTVTATNAQGAVVPGHFVTLSGSALPAGSQNVSAGTSTTITLPSTPGNYTLIAAASGYTSDTETLTITAPGTLSLEELGARAANGGQSIRVTVREANGSLASGAVTVTLSGAISRTVPTSNGTGAAIITVPTTGGTVTLSATGYTTSSYTFSTTGQPTTPTTTPTGPAGVADSLEIDGSRSISGTLAEAIRLRTRVLDANNNGVSDVAVTFRVLSPGRGSFAGARGSGRAIREDTDRNGYATTNFTPTAAANGGSVIVEAKAAGVSAAVSFIIAVDEADDTPTRDADVTPSREINPVVHVGASQRPPMLWVDGGAIYALVGKDAQEFASGVEGALNIAVGGGKVYWTEMTGESAGTINSANLDGSGVKELTSIRAVPMGIAVDTDNSKLYWTNSRGRIQSANLDGSRIRNVLQNLSGPKDLAISRGNLYWTQYDATAEAGSVGIANSTGRGSPKYISTGSDMPGSLVVNGTKVYWTEMTGTSAGTVNAANLNGNSAAELASIRAVPMGIAVDAARSKLYWTNSRGRVQSANLDGSKIQNVVDGLGSPGDMVLSNSIAAPAATATPTTPTTASNKYDVNGDGSVDSKDVDALIVAVAAGVTDAKYDVNGDGKVDIFDVSAVSSKRDDGAAAAPALLGTKLSIVQIDRLQEQIDLLVASNDRSPDTMRLLIYLQQLIVMARPEKTQLLANYPNPFNPETWIPYELADATQVKITIYNAQGVVIRTLALGHQSAGYYTGRDRAAYWDGRNALGEQVASGIYFYQFEADGMSSMRKMVILK